jgi:hypothetical protein
MTRSIAVVLTLVAGHLGQAAEKPDGIPPNTKLLFSADLGKPDALKQFVFTDPDAWRLGKEGERSFLEQHKASAYKPTHRSPFNFALVGDQTFGDFIAEFDCQQTSKEYGHRDMIFVFGFQDPSHFYYVHIASKADDHANQVFIVNDAPRVKISKETNMGNNWGENAWKKVRIERRSSDGVIKVFFDDMTKPIMRAEDKSFGPGWVGVGTFDDTARVSGVRVWGEKAEAKRAPEFKK